MSRAIDQTDGTWNTRSDPNPFLNRSTYNQVSSRSLVFDPVGDASQPLLRFPYKHVARLSKYVVYIYFMYTYL